MTSHVCVQVFSFPIPWPTYLQRFDYHEQFLSHVVAVYKGGHWFVWCDAAQPSRTCTNPNLCSPNLFSKKRWPKSLHKFLHCLDDWLPKFQDPVLRAGYDSKHDRAYKSRPAWRHRLIFPHFWSESWLRVTGSHSPILRGSSKNRALCQTMSLWRKIWNMMFPGYVLIT